MKIDKEKVILAAVAIAGIGVMIALQKMSTPKRRPPPSQTSRVPSAKGVRSAMMMGPAPAGPPDRRSGSRAGSRASKPPGTTSAAAPSRSHSHHPHPHPSAAAHTPVAGESPVAALPQRHGHRRPPQDRSQSQPAPATPAAPLTVATLDHHRQKEGTLGSVSERLSSPDPDAHRAFPVSSPLRTGRKEAGWSLKDIARVTRRGGPTQKSPSNVATLGSMSGENPLDAAAMAEMVAQLPAAADRRPPRPKRAHSNPVPRHPRTAAGAQTEVAWFTENRGTQTEALVVPLSDAITPGRTAVAGHPQDPSMHTEESELALSPIYRPVPLDALDSSAPTAFEKTVEDSEAEPRSGEAGAPFIPRYLLLDAERQLNAIIVGLYITHPHNATSWMVFYCYLKELPASALRMIRARARLQQLPPSTVANGEASSSAPGAVENQAALEKEVGDLLSGAEDAVAKTPYFFKWKGSRIVRRDGDYRAELAKKLAGKQKKPKPSSRFAHMVVCDDDDEGEEDPEKSAATAANNTSGAGAADQERHSTDADRVATVVKRYAFVLMQGASTQTEGAAGTVLAADNRTPNNGSTSPNAYRCANEAHDDNHHQNGNVAPGGSGPVLENARVMQLLQRLIAMKNSSGFDAVRHGHLQQSAIFACDFVEIASEAQRMLDYSSLAGAGSPPSGPYPPTTYKPLAAPPGLDEADMRSSGHGYRYERTPTRHSDSGGGGLSPFSSMPSGAKPSRPSIQTAFRRGSRATAVVGAATSPSKPVWSPAQSAREARINSVFERLSSAGPPSGYAK